MSGQPPSKQDLPPDDNRGPELIAIFVIQVAISLVFIGLRVWARWSIRSIGADDICIYICWIFFAALTVVVVIMSLNGGVRHLAYLASDPTNLSYVLELNYLVQPLSMVSNGVGKISVGLTIHRILGNTSKWRRGIIWFMIVGTIVFGILGVTFVYAQCKNPVALWNPVVKEHTSCWDPQVQSDYNLFLSTFNTFTDFLFALLPITIVKGLNMTLKRKIILCVGLGLSTFTGICAAVKTSQLSSLTQRSDLTWETFSLFAWAGSEIFLMIICSTIPALKPLWDQYVKGKKKGGRHGYNSHGYGYGSSGYALGSGKFGSARYGYERSQSPSLIPNAAQVELASISAGKTSPHITGAESHKRETSTDDEHTIHAIP